MPAPTFFRQLGFFVEDDFIDSAACARICDQIRTVKAKTGTVYGDDSGNAVVDETVRKVLAAKVQEETVAWVTQQLQNLQPRLEEHFRMPLSGFEKPVFLRYDESAFYAPHRDRSEENDTLKRTISVVIFLNAPAAKVEADSYGGGLLTFHRVLKTPPWDKCPLPLEAQQGLLIAFNSNVLHEVRPVTFGQRFTIVTWFNS